MKSTRIVIAIVAALPLVVNTVAQAAEDSQYQPQHNTKVMSPADIATCLGDPNYDRDAIVDRIPVSRPDTPQTEFQLECGNLEIAGARHINVDHPIRNAVTFQRCYSTALLHGSRQQQQYSALYSYQPPLGGPVVEVAVDDYSPFVLTAYTKGPNSADWDGCSKNIP